MLAECNNAKIWKSLEFGMYHETFGKEGCINHGVGTKIKSEMTRLATHSLQYQHCNTRKITWGRDPVLQHDVEGELHGTVS